MNKILNRILAIALLFNFACSPKQKKVEEKLPVCPNVIMILVDEMGYGDLSFCGQKTLLTPIIDKMASEGMHFTNMYTGSTVCAPSRASLMTGLHAGHTSVRGNLPEQLLGNNELTITKVFKNAGYKTGAIGKWGIGHPPPPEDHRKKGFDYFYGYINMWHAHNLYPEFLYENGVKVLLKNRKTLVDGKNPWAESPEGTGVADVLEEYVYNLLAEIAMNYLEANKNNKFFLYMAYIVPHANNETDPFKGDNPHAYGRFLLAGAEIIKLKKP